MNIFRSEIDAVFLIKQTNLSYTHKKIHKQVTNTHIHNIKKKKTDQLQQKRQLFSIRKPRETSKTNQQKSN